MTNRDDRAAKHSVDFRPYVVTDFEAVADLWTRVKRPSTGLNRQRIERALSLERTASLNQRRGRGLLELAAVNGRRLGEFAPDSPLEGSGFELSVPLF
jgi:hypothetical protein